MLKCCSPEPFIGLPQIEPILTYAYATYSPTSGNADGRQRQTCCFSRKDEVQGGRDKDWGGGTRVRVVLFVDDGVLWASSGFVAATPPVVPQRGQLHHPLPSCIQGRQNYHAAVFCSTKLRCSAIVLFVFGRLPASYLEDRIVPAHETA